MSPANQMDMSHITFSESVEEKYSDGDKAEHLDFTPRDINLQGYLSSGNTMSNNITESSLSSYDITTKRLAYNTQEHIKEARREQKK